jgi:hypothetical protein
MGDTPLLSIQLQKAARILHGTFVANASNNPFSSLTSGVLQGTDPTTAGNSDGQGGEPSASQQASGANVGRHARDVGLAPRGLPQTVKAGQARMEMVVMTFRGGQSAKAPHRFFLLME